MRTIGPFVETEEDDAGYSLFWAVEGRGRRGVTCDLRTAEGQALFRRLASHADVVCENFRPGTMEEWNLGPDSLDPRLVYVRISVFGQDGPYSRRPGLDRLGIAYGGLLHLTGERDRPPVRPGVTISDYLTGVFAAMAAVAGALRTRRRGRGPSAGQGAVIDAPLYGAVLRVLEWTLAGYDRLGTVRNREGNRLPHSAPLDNYLTGDGAYVCIVAGSDANFARLCRAMGRPDLLEDPRFSTLALRARHGDEINDIVAEWTSGRDGRGDRGGVHRPRRTGRDGLQRRRHLRRSAHGGPGGPHLRRGPGDRAHPPAGAVPPVRRAPDADPLGGPAARGRQRRGLVRPGGRVARGAPGTPGRRGRLSAPAAP